MFRRYSVGTVLLIVLFLAVGAMVALYTTATASPKEWTPEQRKAVDLAAAFLARNKAAWGDPDEAARSAKGSPWVKGPAEANFVLTYPTPADEVKVLGPRVVVVNIETGEAAFLPRD